MDLSKKRLLKTGARLFGIAFGLAVAMFLFSSVAFGHSNSAKTAATPAVAHSAAVAHDGGYGGYMNYGGYGHGYGNFYGHFNRFNRCGYGYNCFRSFRCNNYCYRPCYNFCNYGCYGGYGGYGGYDW